MTDGGEDALLRSTALRNAAAIQQARERTERELRDARDELRRAAAERERLLAAEQSARAEAERVSRMKDEFLATLSHELRTPLGAILGWTQVLKRTTADPELAQALEVIERNTRLQVRLIDELLEMSRITAGKVRLDVHQLLPVEVVRAAIETVTPAAEAKDLRLETALDPAAGPVHGDPGRLQQAIWNLLSNAIKFTPRGGRVRVALARAASQVEIAVADTGVGIESEFLPHVFERFRQGDASTARRYGGLGLGLAIAKHLVELHGGTVHADSAGEGKGALFRILLPVAALRALHVPERLHGAGAPSLSNYLIADLTGLKVMVVDDDADTRSLVGRVLSDCGASVVAADSTIAAMELMVREHPAVVVTDIGMPDLDGYELLRRLRALDVTRSIPAIALTAFARAEDRTRALREGFRLHLAKPVEPAELVATVASVAGRTVGTGQSRHES
jgi:signal transduction histidine kinase/ActR/RegA family two-component response regulator